jgi:hypothetical protein
MSTNSTDILPEVPLLRIVDYALDELKKSDGDRDRYWVLAFRGLVDLNFDIAAQGVTFRLPVNANKTVNFPPGCLTWSKIGLLNNNGELSGLKINNALTNWKDLNPNRVASLTPDITDSLPTLIQSPFYLNYFYDGVYQPLFGVGGGLIEYGDIKVDEENRVVILQPDFKYSQILFECLYSPEKDTDYHVPLRMQEAIIAFIKWKDKMGTREEFIAEAIKARRRMPKKIVRLQHINQVLRESESQKLRG